ncbi:hypothetical protein [Streptomyces sp. CC208A]|uniref:hypothetical protein n=1 Tax=Streptomyces sp. CC208A TaxID=3044573 RepID=UPI0024A884A6|nr:hypothetical protein [Streptomyces sp. CC208A]
MSDENDRMQTTLAVALVEVYETLRLIGLFLPIPIALPKGPEYKITEMAPAVRRMVELIQDQPMAEEEMALIWGAALTWCSAEMIFGRYLRDSDPVTAMQTQLLIQEAGEALITYLDGEKGADKKE